MSWRYGITVMRLPHGEDYYEIREIYQWKNKHGHKTWSTWTQNPVAASGDTRKEVIEDLEMMLADAKRFKAKRIPYAPKSNVGDKFNA